MIIFSDSWDPIFNSRDPNRVPKTPWKTWAYIYQIETNLLKIFARPENSEGFSTISVIIFEVTIVAEQKQA